MKNEPEAMRMNANVPERVLREIVSFARRHQIEKVILFGSRAKGTHTKRSDIDLAASGGDLNGFYWDLKENIHSLLSFDIVELDGNISDELKKEIELPVNAGFTLWLQTATHYPKQRTIT